MRTVLPKGTWLGVISVAAMALVACAPVYTHPNKKMTREDAAVDVLDCQKAAVLRYKAARLKQESSYEARQAAYASARAAWDRCLKAKGWKKSQ
jgi:hypothetical protein